MTITGSHVRFKRANRVLKDPGANFGLNVLPGQICESDKSDSVFRSRLRPDQAREIQSYARPVVSKARLPARELS